MPVSARRRAAAVLAAALVSATGLVAAPAQAAPSRPAIAQAPVLIPAAYTVNGAIKAKWLSVGGANGFLGRPTGNERRLAGGGYGQTFQGGSIHWSPGNGAYVTKGAIRSKWAASGWENGALGYPAGDERRLRNGGYGQTFQGGSIHWSPGNGAHVTKGAIRSKWAAAGWENGRYGYPTGDEYRTPTGWAQRFQGGVITWTAPAGTRTYRGTGDSVIDISKPDGVNSVAAVQASHTGESNFIVEGLDSGFRSTDLLVNEIGSYSGTTLLDESEWANKTTRLRINADGPWTITVKSTKALNGYGAGQPVSGRGDAVFRYTGGNSIRQLTHDGSSNFIVSSYPAGGYDELLVNEIGWYSGRVTYPGPGLVEVRADGLWSIKP